MGGAHSIIEEIGVSIVAATILGVASHRARQPVILGYLVAGALLGPVGFGLVTDPASIEVISEIGLILLLFVIGMELDLQQIASAGRRLLVAGVGQFVLCAAVGAPFFAALGYGLSRSDVSALYLAVACAMSSTAVVAKLLYDKTEFDTLPGRMTLGVLVIQDLWAIVVLALQPNFVDPRLAVLARALGGSFALLAGGFLLSRYVLKRVYGWIAKSPEMVVALSIGWCAFVAGAAGAMGLSREMGALIAGLSISTFPYSSHITEKALPLRDFFLTLFFVSLGMKVTAPTPAMLAATGVVVLFVAASRFATVWPLLAATGAGRRTGVITSVNLAQMSEFSLVIVSLGAGYGHVPKELATLAIYAMATSCVLSSYAIKYNHGIYLAVDRLLRALGLGGRIEEREARTGVRAKPIVVLGFHRGARSLVEHLARRDPKLLDEVLVVDFNAEVMQELGRLKVAGVWGDISSAEALRSAGVAEARVIISTIPDALLKGTTNERIVSACRGLSPQAFIIATADTAEHAGGVRAAGANEVLLPYAMVGEHLANVLILMKE